MAKALRLLRDIGPSFNFHVNISKNSAFWPSMSPFTRFTLHSVLPIYFSTSPGITLLGAPLGSDAYVNQVPRSKNDECRSLLDSLQNLHDPSFTFHLHRLCASACRMHNFFHLTAPSLSLPHAHEFDRDLMQGNASLNNVPPPIPVSIKVFSPFDSEATVSRLSPPWLIRLMPLVS